ncbi:MAG: hypothetical protein ACOYXO_15685 [Chloroflexota bacterium]
MNDYITLAARIRLLLKDVEKSIQRAQLLMKKAIQTNDDGYWDGVALNLHAFYTGLEHIFEDIARTVEQSAPTGKDWHADLLTQMATPIPNIRPGVISSESRQCLDEYRGFRHVVRNVYAFNLYPARLQTLTQGLENCFQTVQNDLSRFIDFLESLD